MSEKEKFPSPVYIWMINSRGESEFGWLKGIVCRKVDVEEKDSALERGILWTQNRRLQM